MGLLMAPCRLSAGLLLSPEEDKEVSTSLPRVSSRHWLWSWCHSKGKAWCLGLAGRKGAVSLTQDQEDQLCQRTLCGEEQRSL